MGSVEAGNERSSERVALVLTVLNEAEGLRRLLVSIDDQTMRPDEVVICDAGSTDGSTNVVELWSATTDVRVKLIVAPNANIAEGRNAAIRATDADIIAVTDGGCVLDPGWLEKISCLLREGAADAVYGGTSAVGVSRVGQAFAEYYDWRTRTHSTNTEHSSRSVAFVRAAWQHVGGYPEWLSLAGEDTLFFSRLDDCCRTQVVRAAIVEWTHGAESLRAVFSMHRRNAIGAGEGRMWLLRHIVLAGLYGGALFLLTRHHRRLPPAVGMILLGLTVLRDAVPVAKSSRRPISLLVPFVTGARDIGTLLGYTDGLRNSRRAERQRQRL